MLPNIFIAKTKKANNPSELKQQPKNARIYYAKVDDTQCLDNVKSAIFGERSPISPCNSLRERESEIAKKKKKEQSIQNAHDADQSTTIHTHHGRQSLHRFYLVSASKLNFLIN